MKRAKTQWEEQAIMIMKKEDKIIKNVVKEVIIHKEKYVQ